MDKIKCNIEVEVDKGLFYAISAFSELPLSDDTIGAIMKKGSFSISLSDIGLPDEQKKRSFVGYGCNHHREAVRGRGKEERRKVI